MSCYLFCVDGAGCVAEVQEGQAHLAADSPVEPVPKSAGCTWRQICQFFNQPNSDDEAEPSLKPPTEVPTLFVTPIDAMGGEGGEGGEGVVGGGGGGATPGSHLQNVRLETDGKKC